MSEEIQLTAVPQTAPTPQPNPPPSQPAQPTTQSHKQPHHHIDPNAIPYLELLFDEQPIPNNRSDELNSLYQTQIYHSSTRFKGPKLSDGYEELVAAQHPLQVLYPDKFHSTGLAYSATSKSMTETHNPSVELGPKRIFCCLRVGNMDYTPMVMYSSYNPHLKQSYRWKVTSWGTYAFMLITIALAILIYILAPFQFPYEKNVLYLDRSQNLGYDICNLIVCFFAMLILFVAIITHNPKIIIVFIIIFGIDAFINAFRLYDILQFVYLLSQLFTIYLANFYRVLISPTWYFSQ